LAILSSRKIDVFEEKIEYRVSADLSIVASEEAEAVRIELQALI
jgi:hypothetical protein